MQAIIKNLKNLDYAKKNFIKNYELVFNIKLLCFVEPSLIKKLYMSLEKEYENFNDYNKSLIILITNGNLNEKKNIRFNPPWKYYNILSSINFDKKHLFLTNNISESINHNLNQNFKYKYPTFNEWKNTIIKIADSFYNKNKSIERKDYVTKIIIFFLLY